MEQKKRNIMKYLIGLIVLLVASKYIISTPDVMSYFNTNKELVMALAITLASRPLLKRIFE